VKKFSMYSRKGRTLRYYYDALINYSKKRTERRKNEKKKRNDSDRREEKKSLTKAP